MEIITSVEEKSATKMRVWYGKKAFSSKKYRTLGDRFFFCIFFANAWFSCIEVWTIVVPLFVYFLICIEKIYTSLVFWFLIIFCLNLVKNKKEKVWNILILFFFNTFCNGVIKRGWKYIKCIGMIDILSKWSFFFL